MGRAVVKKTHDVLNTVRFEMNIITLDPANGAGASSLVR